MKLLKEIILITIFLFIGAMFIPREGSDCPGQTFSEKTILINQVPIKVDLAQSQCQTSQGLMGREVLKNDGMLFIFQDEVIPSFWMKNTLIPLSIAFIDAKGVIIDIQMMNTSKLPDLLKPTYSPPTKIKYALEVNQGFFKKNNIQVGDSVNF